jgi:FkbM family methyltransferase
MISPAPLWISLSASAIRTLPFGRYQLANALARFANRPFLAKLPADLGGATYICDLQDTISREVCFTGRYEPQETQLAMRLLRPGMTVVDVGANWGYFTLLCAHLVGASGRVIALEPHPRLSSMLAENASANSLRQVEVLKLAAGADAGARAFVDFDAAAGNFGLSRAAHSAEAADFLCESVAVDALLDARSCERVDLIKIDIEGGEADAIRGMTAGLARHRYRFVLLECHPAELKGLGATVAQCLEPFRRAGYQGWHIDHSLEMHRRAAVSAISTNELLAPIDEAVLASDPWPHLLWTAPGDHIFGDTQS